MKNKASRMSRKFERMTGIYNARQENEYHLPLPEEQPYGERFHLSTEGYYFEYRPDNNDPKIKRATLYETKTDKRVDDVRVSSHDDFGINAKSHHDIINYFEARLFLKRYPPNNQ